MDLIGEGTRADDGTPQTYPTCDHEWVPAPTGEADKMWVGPGFGAGHWSIGIHLYEGAARRIDLPPGFRCPVCQELLISKTQAKPRTLISQEPVECYLRDGGAVDRRVCMTAAVNCMLTCDAVRGRKLSKVVIVAREVRPEERTIVPGSARIKDGEIVANWFTAGGDKRRTYTMTPEEARLLGDDLRRAADFAEGKDGDGYPEPE